MISPKAEITEIFSSFQGEGVFVGARQIFVRFKYCNMKCEFCDTPNEGAVKEYSPTQLVNEVKTIEDISGPHHSVSLTGGEPLVYTDFLKELLPMLQKAKFKSYLETNGTLPNELRRVIDYVDIVAMDFKLPSTASCGSFWKEHEEFLKASSSKDVFVKIVASQKTKDEDIVLAANIIKRIKPDVAVVLQPHWRDVGGALLDKMESYRQEFLKAGISKVGLFPQMHKSAGIK